MTRRFLLWVLLSLAVSSQGVLVAQTNHLSSYDDETAYEVYSFILSRLDRIGSRRLTNLVIRQETLRNFGAFTDTEPSPSICLYPEKESEKIIGPAISDYLRVNKRKWKFNAKLKLTIPYQLVPSENVLSLIQKEGWDAFYKKYPDSGGLVDLSAVGFNADKTVAIVSQGGWCGDFCGEGAYYVLEKKDGKWRFLDWNGNRCSWVS